MIEEKGNWITVNHQHVFIPDGKTLSDVRPDLVGMSNDEDDEIETFDQDKQRDFNIYYYEKLGEGSRRSIPKWKYDKLPDEKRMIETDDSFDIHNASFAIAHPEFETDIENNINNLDFTQFYSIKQIEDAIFPDYIPYSYHSRLINAFSDEIIEKYDKVVNDRLSKLDKMTDEELNSSLSERISNKIPYAEEIKSQIQKAPIEVKRMIFMTKSGFGLPVDKNGNFNPNTAYYSSEENRICLGDKHISEPCRVDNQTIIHESIHAIDYRLSKTGFPLSTKFGYKLKNGFTLDEILKQEGVRNASLKQQIRNDFQQERDAKTKTYNEIVKKWLDVSDILDGLDAGMQSRLCGGHGYNYWTDKSKRPQEFFAEYISSKFVNKESNDLMKKYFPKTCEACEELYDEIMKNKRKEYYY